MTTLQAKFSESKLAPLWAKFEPLLKEQIVIKPEIVDESQIKVGESKIGGRPDLPKNQSWFREDNGKALSFLAQINFKDSTQYDSKGLLPQTGIAYFFYSAEQEAWGFDPKDKDKFKVFYSEVVDPSELQRKDFPDDIPGYSRFASCKIEFSTSQGLPDWESHELIGLLTDEELDTYLELTEEELITKLLGHSNNIQGAMEEECQLVTNGLFCGDPSGFNDQRAKTLKEGARDWCLLFQIDSIEEAGMMWGDVGRLYFWIKTDDLKNKLFDKSWMILQCF